MEVHVVLKWRSFVAAAHCGMSTATKGVDIVTCAVQCLPECSSVGRLQRDLWSLIALTACILHGLHEACHAAMSAECIRFSALCTADCICVEPGKAKCFY